MEDLLKNISKADIEKLRMLFSINPINELKEVVTLRVFVEEYSNLIKQNRSKAYYVSVECAFKHLIEFFGIQNSVSAIQLKDVENFLIHLQQKVKPVSKNSSRGGNGYRVYYRTLKAAFNKAVDWGYVKENYFHKVKLPKKQQVNPVFINSDQLSAISNQLKNEVIKDFVVFGFCTGMRLNEIINLTWRNVDLAGRVITVGDESFTTKGRNQRYIPICEEALEVLLRMKNSPIERRTSAECRMKSNSIINLKTLKDGMSLGFARDFVFCKKDGMKYCGNYISRKFKNACVAAGLDPSNKIEKEIHFHSLRHSFASNLVQKGVSLYTIKELLGHSSISTTEIYSHMNMDSLREAVGRLEARGERQEVKGETVKVNALKKHTPSFPFSRGESNEVKIFRINAGE